MISNSSNNKLKASKSSRDLEECNLDLDEDSGPHVSLRPRSEGNNEERPVSTVVFTSRDSRYKSSRTRPGCEFRGSRNGANDRRNSAPRGRGGGSHARQSERDCTDNYNAINRKRQDSMNMNKSCESLDITSNNKYNDFEVKSKGISYNLPEDPRISKLLRRLCSEADVDKALALCTKLQEMIVLPDNARYIRRSFDILGESITDVLRGGPIQCRNEAAKALGKMGHILSSDFRRYWDWLVDCYSTEQTDVRALLMKALYETFLIDSEHPVLHDHARATIEHLQSLLENIHSPAIFMATMEVIVLLSKSYPESVSPVFDDIVDILIGWHLDSVQSTIIKEHAASTLQQLHTFWKSNLTFSLYLLGQFLEDIVVYGEDLSQPSSGRSTPIDDIPATPLDCVKRITGLIEVFNTVMKSLSGALDVDGVSFLADGLQKVLKTVNQAMQVHSDEQLLLSANECMFLLLASLKSKTPLAAINNICLLISKELESIESFNESTVVSMLALIAQTIRQVSASLPLELITTLIGPNSALLALRQSQCEHIQNCLVYIYQCLLGLRNIPLLQDAYMHILGDLGAAYKVIRKDYIVPWPLGPHQDVVYDASEAELVILFHLHCLSDLANESNSIIAMWALQPSILELIAVKLEPCNMDVWKDYPIVQHSIIHLLHIHCSKSNNFVGSSDLTICSKKRANVCQILGIPSQGENSPTCGNFSIILQLLSNALSKDLATETSLLILKCCQELFAHGEKYINNLVNCDEFITVVQGVIDAGACFDKNIANSVHNCLYTVLKVPNVEWPVILLNNICDLCSLHMCNNSEELKLKYTKLTTLLPITVSLDRLQRPQTCSKERTDAIRKAQRWHFHTEVYGEMLPQYFKYFMSYLLFNKVHNNGWLRQLFQCCWPLDKGPVELFKTLALSDERPLILWSQWEAAQLCVNCKLRTPLGKPQDTFMSIEAAIKSLARLVTSSSEDEVKTFIDHKSLIDEQQRIRYLLGFMEQLEKAIYNATEGTASAMPQPDKPVRSFFRTNAPTCREWLSRIRSAVMVVSLHAMSVPTAVRHGEALMKDIISSGSTDRPEFDHAVMKYTSAFIISGDSDDLLGLYRWIKVTANRKLPWLIVAADQAAGKLELAADGYCRILQEEQQKSEINSTLDDQIRNFLTDNLLQCYIQLADWKALALWKGNEISVISGLSCENVKKWPTISITSYHANTMAKFDDSDVEYMEYLSNWNVLPNETNKIAQHNVSFYKTIGQTESTLTNIALNLYSGKDINMYQEEISNCLMITGSCMEESIRDPPTEYLQHATLLYNAATALQDIIHKEEANFKINGCVKTLNSTVLYKVLWWSDLFQSLGVGQNIGTSALRMDLAKMSRKKGNFKQCRSQLQKYFTITKAFHLSENENVVLENISEAVIKSTSHMDSCVWDVTTSRAISETAKLLYASNETRETAIRLMAAASLGISQKITTLNASYGDRVVLEERVARMLLTLTKWVQMENDKLLTNDLASPLTRLVTALPDIGLGDGSRSEHVVPILDSAVGKLLKYGVRQCPTLAKSWNALGAWCYRWGRKMVELGPEGTGNLSENDKMLIYKIIPTDTNQTDVEQILKILSQTRSATDEEDIDSNIINTSDMIEAQLLEVECLAEASKLKIAKLVDVWKQSQKRLYGYYELAAEAYFKYLQLTAHNDDIEDCASVTCTLRLLRLVVKHALGLQSVLESGLATTPTRPWKVIIPQLFSRLNHPEPYVRHRVSELLCRVAEDVPHLITFPAVVGAVQGQKLDVTDISMPGESEEDIDISEDDSEREMEQEAILTFCFTSMVDTLAKQAPETILQVQLLVCELRRITLLWDELWLGSLVQLNAEFTRRLLQLESELMRLKANQSLTQEDKDRLLTEKYRIIMKPVLFVLEQLYAMTSRQPETPHEMQFQERFLFTIEDVLDNLRQPINIQKPQDLWQPLKTFQNQLQQRAHKKTAYSLKMSDISPALAYLKDTVISMPGIHSKQRVTIMSIDNTVSILPTKTKPKKLVFHGSDGKKYTYLFKGLEDLHLDERIMQFLSIANTMMSKHGEQGYRARHYSVIPLGPRSGLISWVDNVTPLFALYKRWQQREATNPNPKCTKVSTVLRPSELFYSKLNPLLREQGIKNTANRKEWPIQVLKQVLEELTNVTPQDLLSREIWCHSQSAAEWREAVKKYTHSTAVMSVIGYVIGLGDRHLDNVLVELATGEVVHIDYNVCFEKGRTLRVPEKVPFRMTPNIRTALGLTGVEGAFRVSCEYVLRTLRKGRETLLTLLEAFVYDPLVDWTVGEGGAGGVAAAAYGGGVLGGDLRHARRQLEREVTKDMLTVRFTEIRPQWHENKEDILRQIAQLSTDVESVISTKESLQNKYNCQDTLKNQLSVVCNALSLGPALKSHPIQTLAQRYSIYKRMRNAVESAQKGLQDKVEECERHIVLHANALETVKGVQLGQWIDELGYSGVDHDDLVFDLVREFLQSAGQSAMITQCDQSEQELIAFTKQQGTLLKTCLDLLGQYGAVARLYPASYHAQHRSAKYLQWAKVLLENKSAQLCREVVAQFQNQFGPESTNNPLVQQVVSFSYQMQSVVGDANIKLQKSYERLQSEGPDHCERLEKIYSEAKQTIAMFLKQEKGAAKALECVTITALCSLNQRYLMMEAAAASSGDCLVDLTTLEGNWFLDDLHLISSLITELSTLISTQNATKCDDRVLLAMECLRATNSLYESLEDLNNNFHGIILPEVLRGVQSEDESVVTVVSVLNDLIMSAGIPLPDLLDQLEMHLRFVIMEMESPHVSVHLITSELQERFDILVNQNGINPLTEASALTTGQMLLLGFSGLFDKLKRENESLFQKLEVLINSISTPWRKVDHIRDAMGLAAPMLKESTRTILTDIFFVKALQTMSEVFSLVLQMSQAFKGAGIATVYDDDRLTRPVKRFTADYVSRQLLGVTPHTLAITLCLLLQKNGLNITVEIEQKDVGAESKVALEDLCRKSVDLGVKKGVFTSNILAQASNLLSNLESSWRRRRSVKILQQQLQLQHNSMQRQQLQLTAHHWLHEDIIALQPGLTALAPLGRSAFMLELRKTSQALINLQPRVLEALEAQRALVSSAEQRLKWAAGANPALMEVMAAFESSIKTRDERISLEQRLAGVIGKTCNALLHHEALRTRTSEGVSNDQMFLDLISQWEKSSMLSEACTASVTPVEESLMELLDPEGSIDVTWLNNLKEVIEDMLSQIDGEIGAQQVDVNTVEEILRQSAQKLRSYLLQHNALACDVRSLLKSMLKTEGERAVGLRDYLTRYKNFLEIISIILTKANGKNLELQDLRLIQDKIAEAEKLINGVFNDLFSFEADTSTKKRPPLMRQDSVCSSPRKVHIKAPETEQKRNVYAVSVWRRVRMKLEGRDPDPVRRYTPAEQIDSIIREAIDEENLALLYEGWTPWV